MATWGWMTASLLFGFIVGWFLKSFVVYYVNNKKATTTTTAEVTSTETTTETTEAGA